MKEKVKTIKKNSPKGITLVALVVTIVVLLILAGITITTIFSDNGIIKTAQDAAEKSRMEEARTKVDLAMADWQVVKHTQNKTFESYLKEKFGEANVTANAEAEGFDVKVDGYTFTVKDNGTVTTVGGGTDVTPGGDAEDTKTPTSTIEALMANASDKNETVLDKYGNAIRIPAGFKIVAHGTGSGNNVVEYTYDKEDGTSTNIPVVQDGVVIKNEADGNEFVWVPVGEIKNDAVENTSNKTPITLGRYSFDLSGTATREQEATVDGYNTQKAIDTFYIESASNDLGNQTAIHLQEWIKTTLANGGYYIARYEASKNETDNTKAASIAGKTVWASITQPDAATAARLMYPVIDNKKTEGYTYYSDLVNSYAWDTAMVFIQTYGTEKDASSYSSRNKSTSFTTTGGNPDKYRNIQDMSGNAKEWTTETSTYTAYNIPVCAVQRGGYYYSSGVNTRPGAYSRTDVRDCRSLEIGENSDLDSFRLTLYVK